MNVREKPVPASSMVPDWWKEKNPWVENKNVGMGFTFKRCFPLFDAITSGYIIKLWADIFVTKRLGSIYIEWATKTPVLETWHTDQSKGYEIPEDFDQTVFKYLHGWLTQTPKQYSCLITHPIGYQDLPFRSLTGIVDTDKLKTDINTPFIVKKDFQGVIEKGTPMFQIIPFKRDNWDSEYTLTKPNEFYFNSEKLHTKMMSSYGRFLREKKIYK